MVESNDLWTVVMSFAVSVILMMVALSLTWALMRFPLMPFPSKNRVFYVTYNGISFIIAAENRKKAAKFLNDYLKAKGFTFTVSEYYLQNFVTEAGNNIVSLGYTNPDSEED